MSILQSLRRGGGGSKSLIGLDISSSAVKLLELGRRGEQYSVEAYAIEPLPPNVVVDKQVTDPKVVGETIARAVDKAGTRTKNAAVAVAGSSVITKTISMPAGLGENEMEAQIKAEADQYIPYSLDEVNLDFQIIGPAPTDATAVEVLLAACRKEQVDSRVAALDIAGLSAKVVDIEVFALENACQFLRHQMPDSGKGKTVAVVDMGASNTSVLILHDMAPVYTRDQAFGGKQLTEDVMRHFGMSFDEANKAKKAGELPENYNTDVLPRFIDDLAQQIDRSFQFFFASATQVTAIDQVILAGGCAHIPTIQAAIQDRLNMPCVTARPFAKMAVTGRAKPAQLAKDEAALLLACGLACRAFDEER
jgi:type IV pilus assembly protein PilM